jgi:hypothetical protein
VLPQASGVLETMLHKLVRGLMNWKCQTSSEKISDEQYRK